MDPNPAPMGPLGLDLMLSRVVLGGKGKNQSQGPLDGGRKESVSRKPYVF